MAVLPIKIYGEPVLRKVAPEVKEITPELSKLAGDMLETMYAAPGIGLAAHQVGKNIRLIVVDVGYEQDEEKSPYILFNPEITWQEGEVIDEEGCLSFPDLRVNIKRADSISFKALDNNGKLIVLEKVGGRLARCIQHEVDHLNGILFVDRLSTADKLLLSGRLKKMAKRNKKS